MDVDDKDLPYYQGKEAAHYFMGIVYLEAGKFDKARETFQLVLRSKPEGKWHKPSDKMWKKTDRAVRSLRGWTVGDVGRKIAIKDEVT